MEPEAATLTKAEAIRAVRASWRLGQVTEAAARLMQSASYHEVTVSDVAREAGISVGTIYQYLSSKEEILLLVLKDIMTVFAKRVPDAMEGIDDPVQRLREGFLAYCVAVDEDRAAVLLAYRESHVLSAEGLKAIEELDSRLPELFRGTIEEAVEAGLLKRDVRADLVAFDLVVLGQLWALKHWYLAPRVGLTEYAQTQFDIVLGAHVNPAS
ncbi:MAG: TetR/AcrR family transcriptional regulator [Acidimicrobiales bacterium]